MLKDYHATSRAIWEKPELRKSRGSARVASCQVAKSPVNYCWKFTASAANARATPVHHPVCASLIVIIIIPLSRERGSRKVGRVSWCRGYVLRSTDTELIRIPFDAGDNFSIEISQNVANPRCALVDHSRE